MSRTYQLQAPYMAQAGLWLGQLLDFIPMSLFAARGNRGYVEDCADSDLMELVRFQGFYQ
ncbi:hypothetical protein [Corynebacterium sp. ES2775-CONJ]|uniref:hypothetical protein n=1 Tax=Corynebacterium sp. ES2775-CONJ TaxID=2974029 RepID=UPI00216990D6|nr:hypothetical protein [Corynebacterium sp. ES2775-CONJ]MCS4490408.1 hypothetical protein [Corynebacterium sp. ES2775-CONJ]